MEDHPKNSWGCGYVLVTMCGMVVLLSVCFIKSGKGGAGADRFPQVTRILAHLVEF